MDTAKRGWMETDAVKRWDTESPDRGRREIRPVGLTPFQNRPDIIPGPREGHLGEEDRRIRLAAVVHPAEHIASPGVVVGESVGVGMIRAQVSPTDLGQIEATGVEVGGGMKEVSSFELPVPPGIGPFLGCRLGHLHQPEFPGPTPGIGIEQALPPDHGLDQLRRQPVLRRHLADQ